MLNVKYISICLAVKNCSVHCDFIVDCLFFDHTELFGLFQAEVYLNNSSSCSKALCSCMDLRELSLNMFLNF